MKKENIRLKDWRCDKDFNNELAIRSKEFAEGAAKTYTWEETKQAAKDRVTTKVAHH